MAPQWILGRQDGVAAQGDVAGQFHEELHTGSARDLGAVRQVGEAHQGVAAGHVGDGLLEIITIYRTNRVELLLNIII